jgi:ubiquinol-cytochrome c reductase cytochrome b subunit
MRFKSSIILGDSENYIMANPMQTPPAIVPE